MPQQHPSTSKRGTVAYRLSLYGLLLLTLLGVGYLLDNQLKGVFGVSLAETIVATASAPHSHTPMIMGILAVVTILAVCAAVGRRR
jgi:hypothetical protein